MANTGTATPQAPGAVGPIRSVGAQNLTRCISSITMGVYATGGCPVTLPTFAKKMGLNLKAIVVLTPQPDETVDRMYGWDGSVSAPKIHARVISSAAETTNATDLSAITLVVEFIFGD
jgi:hypothetical protein